MAEETTHLIEYAKIAQEDELVLRKQSLIYTVMLFVNGIYQS